MSARMKRKLLVAATLTIGAACFLPVASPAQAEGCDKFMFPAAIPGSPPFRGFTFNLELVETDAEFWKGFHVYLQTTDNDVQQAMYTNPDLPPYIPNDGFWVADGTENPSTRGAASGGLTGRTIDFKVRWENSLTTVYKGKVNDDGSASGTMSTSNGNKGMWHSTFNDFRCAPGRTLGRVPVGESHPEREVVADLPDLPTPTAKVAADVDVYNAKNEPDGAGQVVGILRVGNTVDLVGDCAPDSWCEVSGDAVPSGKGWVWGHLDLT